MTRVAIGVAGRFHADRLSESFGFAGAEVKLISSFPASRLRGAPSKSFIGPEVIYRLASKIGLGDGGDHLKMVWFGHRMNRYLQTRFQPDLFVGWSSFSLEVLKARPARHHILMRDSTHIEFQYATLSNEYDKYGITFPRRDFCRKRETKEYELCDQIWVLSEFARQTFIEAGIDPKKVQIIRLGVRPGKFHPAKSPPPPHPLKLIYFGIISFRKGVQYLLEATRGLPGVELSLVGSIEPSFRQVLSKYNHFQWKPPMSQNDLGTELGRHHIAVFPTLEDGFGQTLPEALSSGLIPIATTRCGSAEILGGELTVPPGNADAIRHTIERFIGNPELLERTRAWALESSKLYSWKQYDRTTKEALHRLAPDR